jgi:hypothetical protein
LLKNLRAHLFWPLVPSSSRYRGSQQSKQQAAAESYPCSWSLLSCATSPFAHLAVLFSVACDPPPEQGWGSRMPWTQSRACARLRGCGVASTAAEMPRSQRREVVSTIGAVLPPPLPSPPMNEMQPCYAALPRGVLGWGRGVAGVGVLRTAFVRTHWHQVGRGAHHQVVCCVLMDAPVCCCVLQPPPRPRRWTPRPGRAAGDAVSACSSPPPRR